MDMSATRAVELRLQSLGLALPDPPLPAGSYAPVLEHHGIGFVSGQFPFYGRALSHQGRIGRELTEEQGQQAARIAALNVLAQIRRHLGGFERLKGLLRVEGYVASAPGFVMQPRILDSASALFVSVLGSNAGSHARTAISVDQLPLNSPLELCVSFATTRPA
jgi:enamine deaminase RidA (YjgF/YER057c/UK114 family)